MAGLSLPNFPTPISRNDILAGMLLAGIADLIFGDKPRHHRLSVNPTGGLDYG